MNGFPVAPPADAHGFFLRATKVMGKGGEAAAQPVQTDFRQAVCYPDTPMNYFQRKEEQKDMGNTEFTEKAKKLVRE